MRTCFFVMASLLVVSPVWGRPMRSVTTHSPYQAKIDDAVMRLRFLRNHHKKLNKRIIGRFFEKEDATIRKLLEEIYNKPLVTDNFFTQTPRAKNSLPPAIQELLKPVWQEIEVALEKFNAETSQHYLDRHRSQLKKLADEDPNEVVRLRALDLFAWIMGGTTHYGEPTLWLLARGYQRLDRDGLSLGDKTLRDRLRALDL